jgi:hypothetical protein
MVLLDNPTIGGPGENQGPEWYEGGRYGKARIAAISGACIGPSAHL